MRKELLLSAVSVGIACELSRYAFSRQQKQLIKERDHFQCQYPPHLNGHHAECRQDKGLVVHHIKPQAYLKEFGVDPDFIENGISICKVAHDEIHPDIAKARNDYRPKGDSFVKAAESVRQHLANREPFWNTIYDRAMEVIALRNTQRMEEEVGADLNTGEILVYKAK